MTRVFTFALAASLVALLSAGIVGAQSEPQAKPAGDCSELPAMKSKLERAEIRLKDWAELGRYREADTQLAPPTRTEQRVVFLGDSITDLWSRPIHGGFFPGKPYINRGISGQTTPQMLIRFRQDVIAAHAKAVVILAGTNDIAGNTGPTTLAAIEDNLASMAELARAHKIRVVLASVLPVSDYGHGREGAPLVQTERHPPEQIRELNAWLKRYASENGYTYLDYFSALVDDQGMLKRELSDDGLHPNAQGYAVMGPLAAQSIRAAFKKRR
jgi:lysophospholipase L1-like esterase